MKYILRASSFYCNGCGAEYNRMGRTGHLGDSMESKFAIHEFAPVYDINSKILILGTFPSVKSREMHFYYGHPQNRFWKLLARLTQWPVPQTIPEKKELLLRNRIAIWDVIQSCEIAGSSDSSIRNVVPTQLSQILGNSSITKIYANGKTAEKLYNRYQASQTGFPVIGLPSTSPANASYSLEKLAEVWAQILEPLYSS